MTGLHTHMCVRHTSADAYCLGFQVVVAAMRRIPSPKRIIAVVSNISKASTVREVYTVDELKAMFRPEGSGGYKEEQKMKKNGILSMVIAALLCAIGILIPIVMPKIEIGPMSFTLASHVPSFLAMFISLPVAVAVSLVTAVGFFSLDFRQWWFCAR